MRKRGRDARKSFLDVTCGRRQSSAFLWSASPSLARTTRAGRATWDRRGPEGIRQMSRIRRRPVPLAPGQQPLTCPAHATVHDRIRYKGPIAGSRMHFSADHWKLYCFWKLNSGRWRPSNSSVIVCRTMSPSSCLLHNFARLVIWLRLLRSVKHCVFYCFLYCLLFSIFFIHQVMAEKVWETTKADTKKLKLNYFYLRTYQNGSVKCHSVNETRSFVTYFHNLYISSLKEFHEKSVDDDRRSPRILNKFSLKDKLRDRITLQ